MGKIDEEMIRRAGSHVMLILRKNLPEQYLFHSSEHTANVVDGAAIIGRATGLTGEELNILMISALFHDVGYIRHYQDHEAHSAEIAGEFLRANRVDEDVVSAVERAILSTKVPQEPGDRVSEVLCDADLMHLASGDYFQQMEQLRLEWQGTGRYVLTEYQFHLNSVDFFNRHHYHTEYGKTVLKAGKDRNLAAIRERMKALSGSGD